MAVWVLLEIACTQATIQHVGLHPYTFWQTIQGSLQIEAHQAALSCKSMPQGGAKGIYKASNNSIQLLEVI